MSKRRRLTGRERREMLRRQREMPKVVRQRATVVAAVAAAPIVIALVLILFVLGGDGEGTGDATPVVLNTPTIIPQASPTASVEPGGPPAVDAEPTYTDSGLGIIDIEPGTGPTPEVGQLLIVNYTGWLSDGTMFDTSLDDDQPFQFALGAGFVIPGWDEGFSTMKVGGKRRLIIPPDLAYGEEGRPGIPPNSVLTFDVELLDAKGGS